LLDIITQVRQVFEESEGQVIKIIEEKLKNIENSQAEDISTLTAPLELELNKLGRKLVKEVLELKDSEIKNSDERLLEGWKVERKNDKKSLITVFGETEYSRTYYRRENEVGDYEYTYLVNDLFGIGNHQRLEPLVEAKLIDAASDTSYRKSGKRTVNDVTISDSTVMNKVHKLEGLDEELEDKEEDNKREVEVLYIEADEDHVALQSGRNAIAKLVYVHEGYQEEYDKESSRSRLKNVKYIAGEYKESEEIWLEVVDYLYETYDMDRVKKIFIGGDGDPWIKEGLNWLPEAKFILDRYHLNDYVITATVHSKKHRNMLWGALNTANRDKVSILFSDLIGRAEDDRRKERIREARHYIYNQWEGIKNAAEDKDAINPSAEGHVSHILASRLSSRPMGWSKIGMDRMSKLRAFKFNGGTEKDIFALIRKRDRDREKQDFLEKMTAKKPGKNTLAGKYGEKKDNIPAIKRGKVRGTYQMLKGFM